MFWFVIQLYNPFPVSLYVGEIHYFSLHFRSTCMRICSNQPCIVLLTEKDVWLRVNGKEPISLKANHMALLNCENNIIDASSLNNTLIASSKIISVFWIKISRKYRSGNVAPHRLFPCHALHQRCFALQRNIAQSLLKQSRKKNEHVHYYSLCSLAFSTVKNSFLYLCICYVIVLATAFIKSLKAISIKTGILVW